MTLNLNDMQLRTKFFLCFLTILFFIPGSSYGIRVIKSLDNTTRAILPCEVIEIPCDTDSVRNTIKVKYEGYVLILSDKSTKEELGDFTPSDTVKVGGTYLFYVEKCTPVDNNPSIYYGGFKDLIYHFQAYNLSEGRIVPISNCKFDPEYIQFLYNGYDDFDFMEQ